MERHDSVSVNEELINFLASKKSELIERASQIYNSGNTEAVDVLDEAAGISVLKEDREVFDAITLFQQNINFVDTSDNEIYEFPGFKYNGTKTTLRISKSKVTSLAELASTIESKLSGEGFEIKFPSQLFQFQKRYAGQNLPGKDFKAPSPKTMDMSSDDYESYLEKYYQAHGINKEDDGVAFRKPYTHEQIDYREKNEVKQNFKNEYYEETFATKAKGKGKTTAAEAGKKLLVTATEAKNSLNPFRKRGEIDASNKASKIGWNVIKIAAAGAGIVILGKTFPLLAWTLAGGIVAYKGIKAVSRYLKKRKAKKIEEQRKRNKAEDEAAEKGQAKGKDKGKTQGEQNTTAPQQTKGQGQQNTTAPQQAKGQGQQNTTAPQQTKGQGQQNTTAPQQTRGQGEQNTTAPQQDAFDYIDLTAAEDEMVQDQALYRNLTKQIELAYQDEMNAAYQAAMNATDSKTAEALQQQLDNLYAQRNAVLDRLAQRQHQINSDLGISRSR